MAFNVFKDETEVYWFFLKPAFGIASFIATWIFRSRLAVQGHWQGTRCGGTEPFFYEEVKNKEGTRRIRVGVEGIANSRFTFKREGAVDRLSKYLLFSSEPQANEPDFDGKVYVASDSERLIRALREDSQAQAAIQSMLYLKNRGLKKSVYIQNSPHRLWVEYKTESDLGGQKALELARGIVADLRKLRSSLADDLAGTPSSWDLKNALVSNVLSLIPNALFVAALVYFIGDSMTRSQESDFFYPMLPAVIAGLSVCVLFTALCKLLLPKSSRTHIPAVEFVLLGFASVVLVVFSGYHSANQDLDTVQPRIHSSPVVQKQIVRHRRSTSYYFHTDSGLGGDFRSERRVKVPSDLYHQVNEGEKIDIAIKPGYLGHEWIQKIDKSWE